MELPKKKTGEDGSQSLKHLSSFLETCKHLHRPDHALRVRIVAKPHPECGESSATEDSPKPEAEGSDDVKNGEYVSLNGTYISRRSRDVDFSTGGNDFLEECILVNTELLSQKSYLFLKIFNEMKNDPKERALTIQIEASEEDAFVRLLEFIYVSSMPPPGYQEIVDLLMISDEFQVISCAKQCINLLVHKLNSPISCFELCHKVRWADVSQLLKKEGKDFVANHEIMSFKHELLQLSFSGIETVFSMDSLMVESETVVYDFIQEWAQKHYPNPKDHCSAKKLHLERVIHFPYLTCQKLEEALQCDFFDPESISKAIIEALTFKVREPYSRRLASGGCSNNHLLERHYKRTPVMVTGLWLPEFDLCMVHFSLTGIELSYMFYSMETIESEDFQFGPQLFSLVASCKRAGIRHSFGLRLIAKADILDEIVYDVRFRALSEQHDMVEFTEIGNGTLNAANQKILCCDDLLLGISNQLSSSNCPFLLGSILHLCVEITCKR